MLNGASNPVRIDAPRGSADDVAYEAILNHILSGQAQAGERLPEELLSQIAGVSRTPVRQALRRLSTEGVVTISPNQGACVTQWSVADATDLLQVREKLEPFAVALSVPNLTPTDLHEMEDLCDYMEASVETATPDSGELGRLNNKFHATLIGQARNEHLIRALRSVHVPAMVFRTFRNYSREALESSMRHHRELLRAATAKDADWAASVMLSHLLSARHAHASPVPQDVSNFLQGGGLA